MAINRAPFNALVDDDGSNLIGSVWNKAAIAGVILDPVDVALGGIWAGQAFSAANFWTGVTAGHVIQNNYAISQKTLFWITQVHGAPAPAASPYLTFTLPVGLALFNGNAAIGPIGYCTENGAFVQADYFALNAGIIGVAKTARTNWTGTIYVNLSMTAGLV